MSIPYSSSLFINALKSMLLEVKEINGNLQLEDLGQWLEHELEGYGDFAHFPDYRIVECKQLGIFEKPEQDLQHFEQIHDDCLNERDRCLLRYLHIQQPLLECLNTQDEIQRPWPMRILSSYAKDIIPGYSCVRAWQSYQEPLNERFVHGVLGHLLHLLLELDSKQSKAAIQRIDTVCQAEPQLHKVWSKIYCDAASAV